MSTWPLLAFPSVWISARISPQVGTSGVAGGAVRHRRVSGDNGRDPKARFLEDRKGLSDPWVRHRTLDELTALDVCIAVAGDSRCRHPRIMTLVPEITSSPE